MASIVPKRFGLKYAPVPTVGLEYETTEDEGEAALKLVEFPLDTLSPKTFDVDGVVSALEKDHAEFINPATVSMKQVTRLVTQLLEEAKDNLPKEYVEQQGANRPGRAVEKPTPLSKALLLGPGKPGDDDDAHSNPPTVENSPAQPPSPGGGAGPDGGAAGRRGGAPTHGLGTDRDSEQPRPSRMQWTPPGGSSTAGILKEDRAGSDEESSRPVRGLGTRDDNEQPRRSRIQWTPPGGSGSASAPLKEDRVSSDEDDIGTSFSRGGGLKPVASTPLPPPPPDDDNDDDNYSDDNEADDTAATGTAAVTAVMPPPPSSSSLDVRPEKNPATKPTSSLSAHVSLSSRGGGGSGGSGDDEDGGGGGGSSGGRGSFSSGLPLPTSRIPVMSRSLLADLPPLGGTRGLPPLGGMVPPPLAAPAPAREPASGSGASSPASSSSSPPRAGETKAAEPGSPRQHQGQEEEEAGLRAQLGLDEGDDDSGDKKPKGGGDDDDDAIDLDAADDILEESLAEELSFEEESNDANGDDSYF